MNENENTNTPQDGWNTSPQPEPTMQPPPPNYPPPQPPPQPYNPPPQPYGAPPPMPYGAPPYGPPMGDTSVMSTGQWVATYLIMMIPCVGQIMMFVWAFGSSGNLNRRNYARAVLIIMGVIFALYLIIAIIFGAAVFSIFQGW